MILHRLRIIVVDARSETATTTSPMSFYILYQTLFKLQVSRRPTFLAHVTVSVLYASFSENNIYILNLVKVVLLVLTLPIS